MRLFPSLSCRCTSNDPAIKSLLVSIREGEGDFVVIPSIQTKTEQEIHDAVASCSQPISAAMKLNSPCFLATMRIISSNETQQLSSSYGDYTETRIVVSDALYDPHTAYSVQMRNLASPLLEGSIVVSSLKIMNNGIASTRLYFHVLNPDLSTLKLPPPPAVAPLLSQASPEMGMPGTMDHVSILVNIKMPDGEIVQTTFDAPWNLARIVDLLRESADNVDMEHIVPS